MTALVAALASILPIGEAPREIVFLPEGTHRITPRVNGKAKTITVRVEPGRGQAIAAKLQSDLDARHAENVRPIFDFEHKNGAASAIPTAFRYEPGKGIVAGVEWTTSGRAAIEGRDFSYFSPEFLIDEESGEPVGLPSRGALGGLVNDPAFREIPRIAASDARSEEDPSEAYEAWRESMSPVHAISDENEALAAGYREHVAALQSSGQAGNEQEAAVMAAQADPDMYDGFLASNRLVAAVSSRTRNAIEDMKANNEPGPYELIQRRASELCSEGKAPSHDAAVLAAIEERPDLYEQFISESNERLRVPDLAA